MTNMKALFTSNDPNWETPQNLYEQLNAEFHFTTDVCATGETAKCEAYYTPETDGLSQTWQGVCWMNPPYGKEISKWLQKAYNESLKGAVVVCLIPSRTDTKYWHDYCMKAAEIRFIKGRLKFGGSTKPAPFPSAIIVFNGTHGLLVSAYEVGQRKGKAVNV